MTRRAIVLVSVMALASALVGAQTKSAKPLEIYVVDTEGGKATLFVSPSGESLLIDTGNPGEPRPDRILAMFAAAGVKQAGLCALTHYHVDHIGGLMELAKRIPIAHFIDHGPSVEEREQVQGFQAAYAELYSKAKHTVVKPATGAHHRAGLAHRLVGRQGAEDAAAGRRQAESGLRGVAAEGDSRDPRERPVGRQRDHATGSSARSISAICCGTTSAI